VKHFIRIALTLILLAALGVWIYQSGLIGKGIEKIGEQDIYYDIHADQIYDDAHEVFTEDVEKQVLDQAPFNLSVEAGGCEFTIEDSPDEQFYIEAAHTGKFQYFLEGDTLSVKVTGDGTVNKDAQTCKIKLWVPEGYVFQTVEIELGAGLLRADTLRAADVALKVGAGSIFLEALTATDLSAEVGMGNLSAKCIDVQKVDMACAMGNVELELSGDETDYNYHIKAAVGNVKIGDQSYRGMAEKQDVDHHRDKDVNLDCSVGNITLRFVERDV